MAVSARLMTVPLTVPPALPEKLNWLAMIDPPTVPKSPLKLTEKLGASRNAPVSARSAAGKVALAGSVWMPRRRHVAAER